MTTEKPLMILIKEALASRTLQIPVFHSVAVKLQGILSRSDFKISEVTELIFADQALATQVLRVANSPFYAGLHKATTINNAVVRLGAREVANIAMLTTQQDTYHSAEPLFNQFLQSLWRHALGCATGSRWLAEKTGYRDLAQEAFLAGLLHDIGKLFLLKVIEEICRPGQINTPFSPTLITEVIETMHVEEGFQVMQRWNLPEIYSDVVRLHHAAEWETNNTLLTVVRLANRACHKLGVGLRKDDGIVLHTTQEAQLLGVKEITLAELEIAIEDALQVEL